MVSVSVRQALSAGMAAGLVAAAAITALPQSAAAPLPLAASPAVQLSAVAASLPRPAAAAPTPPPISVPSAGGSAGNAIINVYNAIEPWAQYGVELGAWAVGWLPWPIGLAGAQLNIAYNGIEPLVQASVYSLAYLVDGEFGLIGPTLANGVQTGVNNFIQGEISWLASFLPPLPPINFPVLPGAALRAATAAPRSAATTSQVAAAVAAPRVNAPGDAAPIAAAQTPTPPAQRPVRRGPAPAPALPTVAADAPAPAAASIAADHRPNVVAHPRTRGVRGGGNATPSAASSTKAGRASID